MSFHNKTVDELHKLLVNREISVDSLKAALYD